MVTLLAALTTTTTTTAASTVAAAPAAAPDTINSAYLIGTVLAAIGTVLVGYLVYRNSRRVQAVEQRGSEARHAAELVKAENEGWKTLIETLTNRYHDSQEEIVDMATKLREAHDESVALQDQWRELQLVSTRRIADLEKALELAHARHKAAMHGLLGEIEAYKREIVGLRAEVEDLRAMIPPDTLKRRGDSGETGGEWRGHP